MSVVKRTARRRRRKSGQVAGELFQLVQGDTVLFEVTTPSDGAALSKAQNFVKEIGMAELPAKDARFTVRLVPVLGPPDALYDLVLTTKGEILTTRV